MIKVLDGVRVLEHGTFITGPAAAMLLADLGADVVKVNALHDGYWMSSHIAMCCNRGKRSIALNLKDPSAMEVLHDLVRGADIVQHNMRYDAAERLERGTSEIEGKDGWGRIASGEARDPFDRRFHVAALLGAGERRYVALSRERDSTAYLRLGAFLAGRAAFALTVVVAAAT